MTTRPKHYGFPNISEQRARQLNADLVAGHVNGHIGGIIASEAFIDYVFAPDTQVRMDESLVDLLSRPIDWARPYGADTVATSFNHQATYTTYRDVLVNGTAMLASHPRGKHIVAALSARGQVLLPGLPVFERPSPVYSAVTASNLGRVGLHIAAPREFSDPVVIESHKDSSGAAKAYKGILTVTGFLQDGATLLDRHTFLRTQGEVEQYKKSFASAQQKSRARRLVTRAHA